jgi:hypothetical protein
MNHGDFAAKCASACFAPAAPDDEMWPINTDIVLQQVDRSWASQNRAPASQALTRCRFDEA